MQNIKDEKLKNIYLIEQFSFKHLKRSVLFLVCILCLNLTFLVKSLDLEKKKNLYGNHTNLFQATKIFNFKQIKIKGTIKYIYWGEYFFFKCIT